MRHVSGLKAQEPVLMHTAVHGPLVNILNYCQLCPSRWLLTPAPEKADNVKNAGPLSAIPLQTLCHVRSHLQLLSVGPAVGGGERLEQTLWQQPKEKHVLCRGRTHRGL